MTSRRALLALLASGVAAVSQGLTWLRGSAESAVGRAEVAASGGEVLPWLASLAAVAAVSAALSLGVPRARRALSALMLLVALVGASSVAVALANPVEALSRAVDGQVTTARWGVGLWVALASWGLLAASAVLGLRRPHAPGSPRRQDQASSTSLMWDSLSRGQDPTDVP